MSTQLLSYSKGWYGRYGAILNLYILLRAAVLLLLLAGIQYVTELEFSLIASTFLLITGVYVGTRLIETRLRLPALLLGSILLLSVIGLIFLAAYQLPLSSQWLFILYGWQEWFLLATSIFAFACISTWLYWRFKVVKAIEVVLLAAALLYIFSGHRNYRFDVSKLLNQIAWNLQWHPLLTLVIVGLIFGIFASLYLYLSNYASNYITQRVIKKSSTSVFIHSYENLLWSLAAGMALGLLYILITWIIFNQQNIQIQARLQNGVADETTEGLSPLTFQSALGASSQPAAIVRLENDYPNNPFSPMLYLREAALSKFNGKEMVLAAGLFDPDVPNVTPGERYTNDGFPDQVERMPVTQSVYLLAEHKRSFAIDYPLSLTGLTLPKGSNKFRKAYRAYSMVPTFKLSDLQNLTLGDPNWTSDDWQHFTKTHPDPRYFELANKISAPVDNLLSKAQLLVDYLNTNAIYTLTPRHEVADTQDQTAPFLFGDLRGYCVHFAHAMVYMLRSLGIPARIGTGYLTDLSQSKDGHILLRMSDRHAWPEIYINNKGWVPFDVEPQQVELHAESPVDMSLLEELMDLLGSSEEILPDNLLDDEKLSEQDYIADWANVRLLYLLIALLVLSFYIRKTFYRYGYLLPASAPQTTQRALNALILVLKDWGIRRATGETLQEFYTRVKHKKILADSQIANYYLLLKYSVSNHINPVQVRIELEKSLEQIKTKPIWQRLLRFLNPISSA